MRNFNNPQYVSATRATLLMLMAQYLRENGFNVSPFFAVSKAKDEQQWSAFKKNPGGLCITGNEVQASSMAGLAFDSIRVFVQWMNESGEQGTVIEDYNVTLKGGVLSVGCKSASLEEFDQLVAAVEARLKRPISALSTRISTTSKELSLAFLSIAASEGLICPSVDDIMSFGSFHGSAFTVFRDGAVSVFSWGPQPGACNSVAEIRQAIRDARSHPGEPAVITTINDDEVTISDDDGIAFGDDSISVEGFRELVDWVKQARSK